MIVGDLSGATGEVVGLKKEEVMSAFLHASKDEEVLQFHCLGECSRSRQDKRK